MSESGPGDFRAEPGVDMFNGVSPSGGSTAKVRVAPNGEIFFDYFAVARPLFGSNTGLVAEVNKCLESEEAFRACTDPRDPNFTGGNAEFVRRLNQVRFAPGMHLLAVVHHSTSGYIGTREIEIPADYNNTTNNAAPDGTRTAFFDDLQGPTFTPSRSVRMFPPLVKVTALAGGRSGERRVGLDGAVQEGEDVQLSAVYRESAGWDHFCGTVYSALEAGEFQPPYRAEISWRSADLSEQVPIPEARRRWSLCEGMAPGRSFGLEAFKRFAQQDVVPETPAADRILASAQGTAGGTLPPYLDSDHDGNPDVWMGGFLDIDGNDAPPFVRIATREDLVYMPSLAGMKKFAQLRIGHNFINYDKDSSIPSDAKPPRLVTVEGQLTAVLESGHQAAWGFGPHVGEHVWVYVGGRKERVLLQSPSVVVGPKIVWPTDYYQFNSEFANPCKARTPFGARARRISVSIPVGQPPVMQEYRCDDAISDDTIPVQIRQQIITNCYQYRINHYGLDIRNPDNGIVRAIRSGTVVTRFSDRGTNNRICIRSYEPTELFCYMHTTPTNGIDPLDHVNAGDEIGAAVDWGSPHLHLEYLSNPGSQEDLPYGLAQDPWPDVLTHADRTEVVRDANNAFALAGACAGLPNGDAANPNFLQAYPVISPDFLVCGMFHPRRGRGGTAQEAHQNTAEPAYTQAEYDNFQSLFGGVRFPAGWPKCRDPRPSSGDN